jgi:Domain of Unknown Function (DUF1080)
LNPRFAILLFALLPASAQAQATYPGGNPPPKPELTEIWSPVPPKVEPGRLPGQPPSDAIILFNGKDLSGWESISGGPAEWAVENGELVDQPKAGHIQTKQKFGDVQLHVEWMIPVLPPERKGQDRGNSGVFLQGLYEVQVLDSYDNPTYVNGEAGAIYKQSAPLVNALKPAPNWQAYDIVYYAPRFYGDGTLAEPGRITVFLNGVLVQSNFAIKGPTDYRMLPAYKAHGDAPLMLQAHNNAVRYRNLWVRKL